MNVDGCRLSLSAQTETVSRFSQKTMASQRNICLLIFTASLIWKLSLMKKSSKSGEMAAKNEFECSVLNRQAVPKIVMFLPSFLSLSLSLYLSLSACSAPLFSPVRFCFFSGLEMLIRGCWFPASDCLFPSDLPNLVWDSCSECSDVRWVRKFLGIPCLLVFHISKICVRISNHRLHTHQRCGRRGCPQMKIRQFCIRILHMQTCLKHFHFSSHAPCTQKRPKRH